MQIGAQFARLMCIVMKLKNIPLLSLPALMFLMACGNHPEPTPIPTPKPEHLLDFEDTDVYKRLITQ